MKILKDMDLKQKNQDFGTECSLETWVRLSSESDFTTKLSNINVLCQRI